MISFQPTEDQKLVMDTIGRYVRERVVKARHESDEERQLPAALVQEGWGLGLLAGWIPEDYGGLGEAHSAISSVLYAEELAAGDLSLALHLLTPALVGLPVLLYGTPEQKDRWLPALAADEFPKMTAAWAETHWDFDPLSPRTTAVLEGDSYVLHGHKALVPLAQDAEVILVYATEEESGQVQAFLVEKNNPGMSISPREKNMGLNALATYELQLEGCRVPSTARLGGQSGCDAAKLLAYSKVGLGALAVGQSRAALEYAMNYAKERQAFGRAIAQFQSIAFMLAEMAIEVDAARLMVWEAAWELDQGNTGQAEAALAKMYCDEMALQVADRSVQILGGHGYIREHPVEMFLRNARAFIVINGLGMI
ncbi:MAG TPA: acyl-CoA dehydrogenase family protein [Chloroflexia bacterium]|nr:acyl-CoA dehydrogenase family protein [Chloroflexia bacterium]